MARSWPPPLKVIVYAYTQSFNGAGVCFSGVIIGDILDDEVLARQRILASCLDGGIVIIWPCSFVPPPFPYIGDTDESVSDVAREGDLITWSSGPDRLFRVGEAGDVWKGRGGRERGLSNSLIWCSDIAKTNVLRLHNYAFTGGW